MKKLLLKAFQGQFAIEILSRCRGLILLPVATRALGPEEYGWIAYAAAITGLVGSISTLGLPASLSRFLPGKTTESEQGKLFWPTFTSALFTTLVFAFLTYLIFGLGISSSGIPPEMVVLAAINIVSVELKMMLVNFFRWTLDLQIYYRIMVAEIVLVTVVQLVVLSVLDGKAVELLASAVVVDFFVAGVVLLILTGRMAWFRVRWHDLRPLYIFGLPLAANGLLTWANNSADRFFVEAYKGSSVLGMYSVSYSIAFIAAGLITTPIFSVLPSVIFRAWDEKKVPQVERLLSYAAVLVPAASLPIILSIGFFGEPVVDFLAGEQFAGAHSYILWISLGYLMMYMGDVYGYMLMMRGKQYLYLPAMIVSVVVNLVGNVLLVPSYGAIGSAIATAASFTVLLVILYTANRVLRYFGPAPWRPITIGLLAGGLWVSGYQLWPELPTLLTTAVFSVVTTAVFLIVLFTFRTKLLPDLAGKKRLFS